jgi:hydrogenase maturation protease
VAHRLLIEVVSLKTLVLGLGNPILTDDGVGVRVAEKVCASLPVRTHIDVAEVSVGGLALMEAMIGYDRVLLIDAIQANGDPAGSVHRMTLDDLRDISPTQHSSSPHDTNLITALEMGRCMGMTLPSDIVIYAISVENISDFGDGLTPAVAASVPKVVADILGEIQSLD